MLQWDAYHSGWVGLVGFLVAIILALYGGSTSFIFSHILDDACLKTGEVTRIFSGMFAGITFCLLAIFQYCFARSMPLSLAKVAGIVSAATFVKATWVSAAHPISHALVSGFGVFASLVFLAGLLNLEDSKKVPSPLLLYRWGTTVSAFAFSIGMAISYGLSFLYAPAEWVFFGFQTAYWIAYCFSFFGYFNWSPEGPPPHFHRGWDALHAGIIGIIGFLIALVLAISGGSESYIISHVIADSCDPIPAFGDADYTNATLRVTAGIAAGITVCLVALFLYCFARKETHWLTKFTGISVSFLFVGVAWITSDYPIPHYTLCGTGMLCAVVFFGSLLYHRGGNPYRWILYGLLVISAIGMAVSLALSYFFVAANWAFSSFEYAYWLTFCCSFFGYFTKDKTK